MKILLSLILIILAVKIYSQEKQIETGFYIVEPHDSCIAGGMNHIVVFSSDTLCLQQNPVIKLKDMDLCIIDSTEINGDELYSLNIKLKDKSSKKFRQITEENVGKKLAIVIGNKVVMAPVLRDPITNGRMTVGGEKGTNIKDMGIILKRELGQQ